MKNGVPIRYQHLGHAYIQGGCIGSLCRPISRAVGFSISREAKNRVIRQSVMDVLNNVDEDLDDDSSLDEFQTKAGNYLHRNLDAAGYILATTRPRLIASLMEEVNARIGRIFADLQAARARQQRARDIAAAAAATEAAAAADAADSDSDFDYGSDGEDALPGTPPGTPPPPEPQNTFFYPGVMQYRNPAAVAPRRTRKKKADDAPIDNSALFGEDE